jgi:GNAT superfamily N-acetyltransferase
MLRAAMQFAPHLQAERSTVNVIRAGNEHLDLIVPLFDQYRQFYRQTSDIKAARQFLGERLWKRESVVFLALHEKDSVALGFTQLYPIFSSSAMRRQWVLNDLFVVPGARKTGVGRALMERAHQWALETGADGVSLETATDNLQAQELYEKLGYKRDVVFYRYFLSLA